MIDSTDSFSRYSGCTCFWKKKISLVISPRRNIISNDNVVLAQIDDRLRRIYDSRVCKNPRNRIPITNVYIEHKLRKLYGSIRKQCKSHEWKLFILHNRRLFCIWLQQVVNNFFFCFSQKLTEKIHVCTTSSCTYYRILRCFVVRKQSIIRVYDSLPHGRYLAYEGTRCLFVLMSSKYLCSVLRRRWKRGT